MPAIVRIKTDIEKQTLVDYLVHGIFPKEYNKGQRHALQEKSAKFKVN